MSAQNSAGIQTLLDAEREAQKIVQRAREYRTKRIKDAKSEAQKEIEEYRKQKEEEFKKFEAEHSSGNKKAEEEANKDAEAKLREIQDTGKAKGDRVIEDLIHAVLDVQPEVPDKLVWANLFSTMRYHSSFRLLKMPDAQLEDFSAETQSFWRFLEPRGNSVDEILPTILVGMLLITMSGSCVFYVLDSA